MNNSAAGNPSLQERFGFREGRLYLVTVAMVLGNVVLPLVCHGIPEGGRRLLPILFFTLIAGWRFGLNAGLLTALLSPLANHLLTGMPGASLLPGLILESSLLGVLAAFAGGLGSRNTLAPLVLAVALHQVLVLLPLLLGPGPDVCLEVLRVRIPGLLLQVLGGWLVLRLLAQYLPFAHER